MMALDGTFYMGGTLDATRDWPAIHHHVHVQGVVMTMAVAFADRR
jgi:hypothetical protein